MVRDGIEIEAQANDIAAALTDAEVEDYLRIDADISDMGKLDWNAFILFIMKPNNNIFFPEWLKYEIKDKPNLLIFINPSLLYFLDFRNKHCNRF